MGNDAIYLGLHNPIGKIKGPQDFPHMDNQRPGTTNAAGLHCPDGVRYTMLHVLPFGFHCFVNSFFTHQFSHWAPAPYQPMHCKGLFILFHPSLVSQITANGFIMAGYHTERQSGSTHPTYRACNAWESQPKMVGSVDCATTAGGSYSCTKGAVTHVHGMTQRTGVLSYKRLAQ